MQFKAKTRLDKFFEVSILIKAFDGLLEILGGILLLFVKPEYINNLMVALTQNELAEDPHDFIATHLLHTAAHIDHGSLVFGAVYLIAHGAVKIILVAEILRGRLWAYMGLLWFTIGFMVYQMYRFTYSHSSLMLVLTAYDAIVVWLTILEYRKRRQKTT